MSKSVLVMNTPDTCDDCILARFINGKLACCATESIRWLDDNYMDKKSDWCSLKEMPERMREYSLHEYSGISEISYVRGYNDCFDSILDE